MIGTIDFVIAALIFAAIIGVSLAKIAWEKLQSEGGWKRKRELKAKSLKFHELFGFATIARWEEREVQVRNAPPTRKWVIGADWISNTDYQMRRQVVLKVLANLYIKFQTLCLQEQKFQSKYGFDNLLRALNNSGRWNHPGEVLDEYKLVYREKEDALDRSRVAENVAKFFGYETFKGKILEQYLQLADSDVRNEYDTALQRLNDKKAA